MTNKKVSNSLINETSPYLLQHAYNPVKWLPWSNSAFEKAQADDKLVIVSIGYSACHWCHVMEHESFENEEVAELMNEYFVNIKVDREERPDVDNLYMTAVQLMTGHGGWPLNCITLSDGRPIYGGTYFNKQQWVNVLKNLTELYKNDKGKVYSYAESLTHGIKQAELINTRKLPENISIGESLKAMIINWKERLDDEHGGPKKAPKFPLPNNYLFLLRYAYLNNDNELMDHVDLTLTKMAKSGLYDQVHGGFARYSTDMLWKVPHFEKMLYDNAQLVSLYCEAYRLTNNSLYEKVINETLGFIEREWLDKEGCFYSALDADSEGEEGKYYVWSDEELKQLLNEEYDLFADYFQVNGIGYWEHGNNILMCTDDVVKLLAKYNITLDVLNKKIAGALNVLRAAASKRKKPGLDDKTLTAWNALTIKAFAEASLVFNNSHYSSIAVNGIKFILSKLRKQNGELLRTYKKGQAKIEAFLDDYVFTVDALLSVFLITSDHTYLSEALALNDVVLKNFRNDSGDLFYYTNCKYHQLISQQTETSDNVIPSSNSQMAINLFALGLIFDRPEFVEQAKRMLHLFLAEMANYGSGYSNWACLALNFNKPFYEIVIVGNNVNEKLKELYKQYFTNTILVVSETSSELSVLKDRFKPDQTLIYVCRDKTCQLPVSAVEDALMQFEKD